MKSTKLSSLCILLLSAITLTRCTPDTTGIAPSTEETLVKNAWSVDYYYHDQDMTNSFGSSRLLFSSTGVAGYQKDGLTIGGTWSRTVDAAYNEWITLHFNTSDASIGMLNRSWKLTSRSANSFQFEVADGASNSLFRIKRE